MVRQVMESIREFTFFWSRLNDALLQLVLNNSIILLENFRNLLESTQLSVEAQLVVVWERSV